MTSVGIQRCPKLRDNVLSGLNYKTCLFLNQCEWIIPICIVFPCSTFNMIENFDEIIHCEVEDFLTENSRKAVTLLRPQLFRKL